MAITQSSSIIIGLETGFSPIMSQANIYISDDLLSIRMYITIFNRNAM